MHPEDSARERLKPADERWNFCTMQTSHPPSLVWVNNAMLETAGGDRLRSAAHPTNEMLRLTAGLTQIGSDVNSTHSIHLLVRAGGFALQIIDSKVPVGTQVSTSMLLNFPFP